MLNYLDKLSAPEWLVIIIVFLAVITDIIGLISKLWGVAAPKIFKISTHISRKKEIEQVILSNQEKIQKLEQEQIKDREASKKADKDIREEINKTNDKLDELNGLVVSMHIDNLRVQIMDFASACRIRNYTREQYHEVFQLCEKYKNLIKKYEIENGVFVVSLEIIKGRYKELDEQHGFLEDKFDEYM